MPRIEIICEILSFGIFLLSLSFFRYTVNCINLNDAKLHVFAILYLGGSAFKFR